MADSPMPLPDLPPPADSHRPAWPAQAGPAGAFGRRGALLGALGLGLGSAVAGTAGILGTADAAGAQGTTDAGGARSGWPVFDVADFGATADGTTDDAPAVRAAIAAASEAGGGVVYFGAGRYRLGQDGDDPWSLLLRSDVELRGASQRTTILELAPNTTRSCRILSSGRLEPRSSTISQLTLDGNREGNRSDANDEQRHGVFLWGATDVLIERVTIRECTGDAVYLGTGTSHVVIRQCELRDTDRNGITLAGDGEVDDIHILYNHFEGIAVQDIDSEPNSESVISNVVVFANLILSNPRSRYSITTSGLSGTRRNHGWRIVANEIHGAGMNILWVDDVVVSHNVFDLSGSTLRGTSCIWARHHFNHAIVSDNILRGGYFGVRAGYSQGSDAGRHLTISGNQILGSHAPVQIWGIRSVSVTGNIIDTTTPLNAGQEARSAERPGETPVAAVTVRSTHDIAWVLINANSVTATGEAGIRLWASHASIDQAVITANVISAAADELLTGVLVDVGGEAPADPLGQLCCAANVVASPAQAVVVPDGVHYLSGGNADSSDASWCGSGDPEGSLAAQVGATYRRSDGGPGQAFYIKESDPGGTGGWQALGATSS